MSQATDRRDDDGAHDVLAAEEFVMPAPDPELHAEEPHDVLAAEEFELPAPDPVLHETSQPAHDVLAAEEFEVGSADPALHRRPLSVPADASGIAEPHDVLAAEEFALPAGPDGTPGRAPWTAVAMRGPRASGGARAAAIMAFAAFVAMLMRRRRR